MVTGRRKLLLADDSITIQKVVSLTFVDEGMDVATAGDGEEAIRLLEESVPDIVLADVSMPRLNGYEVCERIKGDERFRHIPVMLLVGSFEPFNEAEARRVGADDVVTKPFQSIRNLVNKVGSLLGGEPQADQHADTMDLAPYRTPSPDNTTAGESDAPAQPARVAPDPAASFADLDMDDELIEATPAERFGSAHDARGIERGSDEAAPVAPASHEYNDDDEQIPLVVMRPDASVEQSPSPVGAEDTHSFFDQPQPPAQSQDTQSFMSSTEELSTTHEPAANHAFAAHGGATSDDALLDLDGVDTSSGSVAAVDDDDLILDLNDEEVASAVEAAAMETHVASDVYDVDAFVPVAVEADAVHGEVAEATHDTASRDFDISILPSDFDVVEATPEVVEPSGMTFDAGADLAPVQEQTPAPDDWTFDAGSAIVGADAAATASAVDSQTPLLSTATRADEPRQTLTAEQMSPDVIDAIARRAVELLSERVVREIAWEVVPQLAELLIKRRLDEEN